MIKRFIRSVLGITTFSSYILSIWCYIEYNERGGYYDLLWFPPTFLTILFIALGIAYLDDKKS